MIVGYAVLYNFPGIIHLRGTSYEELIQVGCFAKSVQRGTYRRGKPIFACVNHRLAAAARNTEDGRLRLFEDSARRRVRARRRTAGRLSRHELWLRGDAWWRVGPRGFHLIEARLERSRS